jgi:hypothetical protein
MSSELSLRSDGSKHYVTALGINGQTAPMPDNTLYFDLGAREGATWSNSIGSMTVVTRGKTVKKDGRTYTNCIQIRETNKEGNKLYWTFAPGVGFVQFGEDSWGFLLDESSSKLAVNRSPDESKVASTSVGRPGRRGGERVMVGLAANPTAGEGYNPKSVERRFNQSVEAGVNFIYYAPKWNEIEPSQGKYNFKDLDFHVAETVSANIPLILNIRTIDTNQRSMPKDLASAKFSDRRVSERLTALITAMTPRLKGRVTHVMIGNEVNSYFNTRNGEVSDYLTLYKTGADRFKELVPGGQTSVNFTFDALGSLNSYLKPLLDASDFLSMTYYPANPDFTFRDPSVVDSEFSKIIASANGKRVLLQEVGYASSPLNNSSEEKQAMFVARIFDNLRRYSKDIIGVNFLFMSDLADETVDGFAKYYKMPNADRFKAFLKTLGMFDDSGRPKKSWEVFRTEAQKLK